MHKDNTASAAKKHGPRIWYIYPAPGGPGLGRYWRAYLLSREWSAMGIENLVIAPGYHHQFHTLAARSGFEDIDGALHYFLPMKPYSQRSLDRVVAMLRVVPDLLLNPVLRRLGQSSPPDVVIYSSPYPFGVLGAWALARRLKARLVFEVRDIWPLSLTDILKTPRWHPFVVLAGICERFAYKRADRVVSLLPYADRHMVARGMAPSKFCYIPNGIQDTPIAAEAATHPLVQHAMDHRRQGHLVVVHAGNMGETTPLLPLLEAAAQLESRGQTDVKILLVGRGDSEGELRARASELQLTSVEFHAQVERAVITALCEHADIGFASFQDRPIYEYGMSPNKVYDYMLAGLPILFAHTERENQITETGGAIGCAVDDPDAIAQGLTKLATMTADERRALGRRGRNYVLANHDYFDLARRYLETMGLEAVQLHPKDARGAP